jgi:hypothetical protein
MAMLWPGFVLCRSPYVSRLNHSNGRENVRQCSHLGDDTVPSKLHLQAFSERQESVRHRPLRCSNPAHAHRTAHERRGNLHGRKHVGGCILPEDQARRRKRRCPQDGRAPGRRRGSAARGIDIFIAADKCADAHKYVFFCILFLELVPTVVLNVSGRLMTLPAGFILEINARTVDGGHRGPSVIGRHMKCTPSGGQV